MNAITPRLVLTITPNGIEKSHLMCREGDSEAAVCFFEALRDEINRLEALAVSVNFRIPKTQTGRPCAG